MDRYHGWLDRVDELKHAGLSFSEIEDWIDGLDGSKDEKAALWLFAHGAPSRHPRVPRTTQQLEHELVELFMN